MAKSRAICPPWRGPPPRGNFSTLCTFPRKNIIFGKICAPTFFLKKNQVPRRGITSRLHIMRRKVLFFSLLCIGKLRKIQVLVLKHVITQKYPQNRDVDFFPGATFRPPPPFRLKSASLGRSSSKLFF